jgi:hypothetical protein
MLPLVALAVVPRAAHAQRLAADTIPIQDNSFLMEEAYNQEARVVQHISTLIKDPQSGLWTYSFTQEWPVRGQRNQLSYTLPVADQGGRSQTGIGDVLLNYRLQVISPDESKVAFAPRLSAIFPTGRVSRGLGRGSAGLQFDLPLSVELSRTLVAHTNAGFTWTPRAENAIGNRASLMEYNAGQSFVWLATPMLNFLVENVYQTTRIVVAPNRSVEHENLFVSPGVRMGFNFRSGLQIVPGLAVPFEFGDDRHDPVALVYLSFEHPF